MHFAAALVVLWVSASPVLLEGTTTCQIGNQKDHVNEQCPVEITSSVVAGNTYTECVTVRVWMKDKDLCKSLKLKITSPIEKLKSSPKKCRKKIQCENKRHRGEKVSCDSCNHIQVPERNTSLLLWELVHDCVQAKSGDTVSVFYGTKSTNCSVTYRVEGKPDFDLSVNSSSKSINVAMKKKSISVTSKMENTVNVRHCYQNEYQCTDNSKWPPLTIDVSQSATLSIPYLLPCVCIEAYYTHLFDAERRKKCPLQNTGVMDARDVFSSSEIILYREKFVLSTLCPASQLNISVSLCWMQRGHLCTPVLNSSLEKKNGVQEYDISTVDKHPQMCVQLSVRGTHNISCPFKSDESSWEVYIGPEGQNIIVYLDSSSPATFSTQLCVLTESGCTAIGKAHSLTMAGNTSEKRIKVPLDIPAEKPCVQVWQSVPARHGKRILCPNYTHNRSGMYAVAALIFVFVVGSLGIFIHRATKRGAAGWLYIQRPLLLVCSSDQSDHISAVCALASILQEELGAAVRTALWAQSSQSQDGSGPGVADLGPLPWLYGQWDAVCKEQGKVLVIWSPEAKKIYEKRREARASTDKSERKEEDDRNADVKHEKPKAELEEDLKQNGRRLEKSKKEKDAGKKDCVKLCNDKNWYQQKEASTVIEPMFTAVLTRLERALEECKNQGVVLVYFQGLGHSRDIPKAFSEVRQYCLPQDFRGLIGELGEMRRGTETDHFRWDCWSRVLSKVLAIWLAQKLTHRLQRLVPQTQENKVQSKTSSVKMTSDRPESRLKWPLAARSGTVQEHELLHESPWKAEKF
ncbi:interleukin-17 receptor E [Archocentrus centrarchus]|uniref:interleukin-17 receptor E n=1 Tax=Archocentrus centrarchus TaxID=63155 RepID=UPI0011EA33C7|nr:interleukin-17 receptor E [Archocentrus centrarchus]